MTVRNAESFFLFQTRRGASRDETAQCWDLSLLVLLASDASLLIAITNDSTSKVIKGREALETVYHQLAQVCHSVIKLFYVTVDQAKPIEVITSSCITAERGCLESSANLI
jgi:hypothetical protein